MNKRTAIPTSIAAERLGCSTRHVRNLFWSGVIQGYFVGTARCNRGLRLYSESIDRYKNQDPLALREPGELGE